MARDKDIRLRDGAVVIPAGELQWQFVRSSGPGGQHVNRTSSKAILRFDVRHSPSLPEPIRRRLLAAIAARLTREGHVVIVSQRFRDQPQNAADCIAKLSALVERAIDPPKIRRATKIPRSVVARRLVVKRRRGETKALRRRPPE